MLVTLGFDFILIINWSFDQLNMCFSITVSITRVIVVLTQTRDACIFLVMLCLMSTFFHSSQRPIHPLPLVLKMIWVSLILLPTGYCPNLPHAVTLLPPSSPSHTIMHIPLHCLVLDHETHSQPTPIQCHEEVLTQPTNMETST